MTTTGTPRASLVGALAEKEAELRELRKRSRPTAIALGVLSVVTGVSALVSLVTGTSGLLMYTAPVLVLLAALRLPRNMRLVAVAREVEALRKSTS